MFTGPIIDPIGGFSTVTVLAGGELIWQGIQDTNLSDGTQYAQSNLLDEPRRRYHKSELDTTNDVETRQGQMSVRPHQHSARAIKLSTMSCKVRAEFGPRKPIHKTLPPSMPKHEGCDQGHGDGS